MECYYIKLNITRNLARKVFYLHLYYHNLQFNLRKSENSTLRIVLESVKKNYFAINLILLRNQWKKEEIIQINLCEIKHFLMVRFCMSPVFDFPSVSNIVVFVCCAHIKGIKLLQIDQICGMSYKLFGLGLETLSQFSWSIVLFWCFWGKWLSMKICCLDKVYGKLTRCGNSPLPLFLACSGLGYLLCMFTFSFRSSTFS